MAKSSFARAEIRLDPVRNDAPVPGAKTALYLRVSTAEQTIESQRPGVLQLVRARAFDVVKVYEEVGSAAKKRPVLDRLVLDAHRGEFEVLVVWALDRLGRSLFDNVTLVRKLSDCGVRLVSVREPWMDTGGPTADLTLAILSWVSSFERQRLRERTRAGLARARAQGKQIGRPRAKVDVEEALRLLNDEGLSYRRAAKKLGIGASTLHRIVEAHRLLNSGAEAE